MLICDLEGDHEAETAVELEHALSKRDESGLNHFQLFHGSAEWPSLIIMANGEIAWLYFLLSSEHAGYYSVGSVPGLDPKGRTRFVSPGPQEEQLFNDQLVPFADALKAAEEFRVTGQLPQCVDWCELP
jgi:hypothetical protein